MTRILTRFEAELRAPFYIVFHDCSILHGRDKPAACFYGDAPIRSVDEAVDMICELATEAHFSEYRAFRVDPVAGTFAEADDVYEAAIQRLRDSRDQFALTTLHERVA